MRISYNVTGNDRKALVKVISQATGERAVYKFMPTCAYEIGFFTVTKDGTLEFDDCADSEVAGKVLEALTAAGYEGIGETAAAEPEEADKAATGADTAEEPEGVSLTVKLPMGRHTGNTLRNLVNLVYTRASLVNKALGTDFRVDEGLAEALQAAALFKAEDFLRTVGTYEEEHGKAISGLTFTPEDITFASLPETAEPEVMRAFTELCAMMNKQALAQKRIQAKAVNEENEKYALRIWLTRLGMNGPDHKETRKVLMRNLSGHCAFRTDAEKERWTRRQAEKREAVRQASLPEEQA